MKILITEKLSENKMKTPEGYLICQDAVLARTGKQTYRKNEIFVDSDDESEIEVDRPPEEVFSEATLASFENKPITVEHPDEDVNAENYKEYSVGFVRDVKRGRDSGQDVILGTLVIQDKKTIDEILNGEHTDLSCGYDCDIVDENNPVQRNIRGNHVALCAQGRAGNARIVDTAINKEMNEEMGLQEMDDSIKDATYLQQGKTYATKSGGKLIPTKIYAGYNSDGSVVAMVEFDYVYPSGKKIHTVEYMTEIYKIINDPKFYRDSEVEEMTEKYEKVPEMKDEFFSDATQIKNIDKGYAILLRRVWDKRGEQAYAERWTDDIEEARRLKSTLERNDGFQFVIVQCHGTPKKVVDEEAKEEIDESVKDCDMKDVEKWKVGQRVKYHGEPAVIRQVHYDKRYGYDLLVQVNGENEPYWVGENVTKDSIEDAQHVFEIRWMDLAAKSKGWADYKHNDKIKAGTLREALEKLGNTVGFGVGTANMLIISIHRDGASYQYTDKLSNLLKKDLKDEEVEDAKRLPDTSELTKIERLFSGAGLVIVQIKYGSTSYVYNLKPKGSIFTQHKPSEYQGKLANIKNEIENTYGYPVTYKVELISGRLVITFAVNAKNTKDAVEDSLTRDGATFIISYEDEDGNLDEDTVSANSRDEAIRIFKRKHPRCGIIKATYFTDAVEDADSFTYKGIFVAKLPHAWRFTLKGKTYEVSTDKEANEIIDGKIRDSVKDEFVLPNDSFLKSLEKQFVQNGFRIEQKIKGAKGYSYLLSVKNADMNINEAKKYSNRLDKISAYCKQNKYSTDKIENVREDGFFANFQIYGLYKRNDSVKDATSNKEWELVCKTFCKKIGAKLLFVNDYSFGYEDKNGRMVHMNADELQRYLQRNNLKLDAAETNYKVFVNTNKGKFEYITKAPSEEIAKKKIGKYVAREILKINEKEINNFKINATPLKKGEMDWSKFVYYFNN